MQMVEVNALKEWVKNWFVMNRHYHPYAKSNNIPIPELYDILERMATIDAVPVVRCRECVHKPTGEWTEEDHGMSIVFPDQRCPCRCEDNWYSWMPNDDWFCGNGERKDGADNA